MKVRTPIRPMVVTTKRTTYLPHLLVILLLWAVAMTLDYHDQVAAERERADRMTAQMVDCLNGKWRGISADGVEVGCMRAVTN